MHYNIFYREMTSIPWLCRGLRSADFGGKITHSPTCVYDAALCI